MEKINSAIITGATGMIGRALVSLCESRGIKTAAVIRPGSRRAAGLRESEYLRLIECDAAGYESLVSEEGYDAFFHLAWAKTTGAGRDDAALQCRNIEYTLDAVRAAERCGCRVFIGAGSQAEYGNTDRPLNSSTPCDPSSGYGIAKYAAGKLSRLACSQAGIRHCWMRILSVYGEYDHKNSLVMYCLENMLENRPVELTPCGQTWDYIYCRDAARALLCAAESGRDGAAYCVGSGECRVLSEYVEDIAAITGSGSPIIYGARKYYPGQAMYLCADISELTADTGFVPETSFEKGIRNTIQWLTSSEN